MNYPTPSYLAPSALADRGHGPFRRRPPRRLADASADALPGPCPVRRPKASQRGSQRPSDVIAKSRVPYRAVRTAALPTPARPGAGATPKKPAKTGGPLAWGAPPRGCRPPHGGASHLPGFSGTFRGRGAPNLRPGFLDAQNKIGRFSGYRKKVGKRRGPCRKAPAFRHRAGEFGRRLPGFRSSQNTPPGVFL